MSFIRTAKRENPFVQIDKYFLEDENISFEAKGLLAYILSKPDKWKIRKTDLIKRSKSGQSRVESAMIELMAHGYLNWYREREEDGTFGDWIYDVYERPEFNPEADKFIAEGKERAEKRKRKNQEKIAKRKEKVEPKLEIPILDSPKLGIPTLDIPTLDNPPSSNNDFNDIELSNNDLNKEEEEGAHFLFELFKKNINSSASEATKDEFKKWISILTVEVIADEIKYAGKQGGKSFAYLEKALQQNEKLGIKTLLQLQNKRIQYTASKKQSPKRKKTHVREEVLPEWFTNPTNEENGLDERTGADNGVVEAEKQKVLADLEEKKRIWAEKYGSKA